MSEQQVYLSRGFQLALIIGFVGMYRYMFRQRGRALGKAGAQTSTKVKKIEVKKKDWPYFVLFYICKFVYFVIVP